MWTLSLHLYQENNIPFWRLGRVELGRVQLTHEDVSRLEEEHMPRNSTPIWWLLTGATLSSYSSTCYNEFELSSEVGRVLAGMLDGRTVHNDRGVKSSRIYGNSDPLILVLTFTATIRNFTKPFRRNSDQKIGSNQIALLHIWEENLIR